MSNRKTVQPIPCAWCGSSDTYFKGVRNWEEDERGNEIMTADYDDDYSPRDEVWMCNDCEDEFLVMCDVTGDEDTDTTS